MIDFNLLLLWIIAAECVAVGFCIGCVYTERKCLKILSVALAGQRHRRRNKKEQK